MKNSIKTIIAAVAMSLSVTAVSLPASADVADGFPPAFHDAISPASYHEGPEWVREAFNPARFDIEDAELREAIEPVGFFDDYSPELREALEPVSYLDGYSAELREALEPAAMKDVPAWASDAFAPGQNDERSGGLLI